MAYVPNSGSVAAWIQSNNSSVITVGSGSVFAVVQGLQGASVSGTVTANQGTNPWIITGSVQASLAPAANQSVSGTVGASVIGLTPVAVTNIPSISGTVNIGNTVTINPPSIYGNISGSVVAFINNTPAVSVQGTIFVSGSVITVGGSGPANQSVSGTVGASIIGNVSTTITSVATVGGFLNVNLVGGSILTSSTPNQSVSGTVNVLTGNSSVITVSQGSIATVIVGGSIAASFTPPANQSVSGAVSVSNFPTTQNVSGSVVATQGTNPWTVVSSISGGIFPISGSVAATITNTNINVGGSVVAFQGTGWSGSVAATVTNTNLNVAGSVAAWLQSSNASVITVGTAAPNQSVSGTVGASIIGLPPVNVTNFPTNQNVSGSVVAFVTGTPAVSVQGTVFVSGSVVTVGTAAANQSVSGTVQTDVRGSVATVIIGGSIAASFTPPANQSVSGVVMAQGLNAPNASVTGNPVYVGGTDANGSVQGAKLVTTTSIAGGIAMLIIGSVQGSFSSPANQSVSGTVNIAGNPSISGTVAVTQQGAWTASIIGGASVFQTGTWKASIASNYAVGSASIVSAIGNLELGVRNDTLGSIFAADGQYTPFAVGPVGEVITQNSPLTAWTSGVASVFTGVPQPIITSVAARYIYVTGVQVSNTGGANVLVSFSGAGLGSVVGSTIGYTTAATNGGSNIIFLNPLKTGIGNPFQASINGVASIFISAQGFLSKT